MARSLVIAVSVLALFGLFTPVRGQSAEPSFRDLFDRGLEQLRSAQYDDAVTTFRRLTEMEPTRPEPYYNIACAYALQRRTDRAIHWLERAIEAGFTDPKKIDEDADLDPIRSDVLFLGLMHRRFDRAAPSPALRTFAGEEASLERLRGHVAVLVFWRSYSEPCRAVVPHLNALQEAYAGKDVAVIGVSSEDVAAQEAVADELKVGFTLLRQVAPLTRPFEAVRVFPTIFVLDAGGTVRGHLVGLKDRAELDALVDPLVAEPVAPPPGSEKPPPQIF